MSKKFKFMGFIAAAAFSLQLFLQTAVFAEEYGTDFSETVIENTVAPEYSPAFSLPENMRGTIISPGIDFFTSPDDNAETISSRLDELFDEIESMGLNSVIIKTADTEKEYYDLNMNGSAGDNDIITTAVQKAQSRFLNVYLIYDIMPVLKKYDLKSDAVNALISEAHRFAIKYPCDGIILDSYYSESSPRSFGEYMNNGSGIGFENWLYDSTEYYFETVSHVIRVTNNNIPVGIMINDVWANSVSVESGSQTQDSVEAYFDGYADTKKYIEDRYADFTMIRAYGALDDGKLPFKETSEWWGGLCAEVGIPMYLIHYNEKIGTDYAGWGAEDQLLRQLTTAKDINAYKGSIFNSYISLSANPLNTTTKLKQFYEDKINEEALFSELKMTFPKEYNFTTYEPFCPFAGSFDENYDVYFNGNRIELNEAGRFYFEESLSIGLNTFTIKHKSKTYTYKIDRKIITLRELAASVSNGKSLRVDGETSITIEAVAYKDAEVVATLNGQTIKLKPKTTISQNEDLNTSYTSFTGKYKVPAGIVEQEQGLGQILVQASYLGNTGTLYGASVTVNAKPKPPEVIIEKEMFNQDSLGSGEIIGTIDPVKTESETVKFLKVNGNNTHVLDAKNTGTVYTPEFNQLPAGTIDYFKADVGGFYTTESGKRFFAKDVTVTDGMGIGYNSLIVKSSGTYGGDSYFKIALDKRTSFRVESKELSFYSEWGGDYNVSGYNAEYIYITFDNITSVTKLPSFEANMVFSSGKWEQVTVDGIPKFRLILKLRQPGIYMGVNSYYNNDGDLMLTFPVMQNVLSTMTVVIDPGHGYGRESAVTFDPGAIGHVIEQEVNLAIAKSLEKKLTALGVNVVRLRTEEKHYLTVERPIVARSLGCDLFISIHANTAPGKSGVKGTEVYYYTPYSQPLASSVSSRIASYFAKNVYTDGANQNRGSKYLDFWVTLQQDFPSILIETGFVSNLEDAMALANTEHQGGIADAIISGIKDYISRSNINYSTDGSVIIPGDNVAFTPENTDNSETASPETTDVHESEETTLVSEETAPSDSSVSETESEETIATSEITEAVETIETIETSENEELIVNFEEIDTEEVDNMEEGEEILDEIEDEIGIE